MANYSGKLFIGLMLVFFQCKSIAQVPILCIEQKPIPTGSDIQCEQGIFQIIEDFKTDVESFKITTGYKTIQVSIEKTGLFSNNIYSWDILYEGFGEFNQKDDYGNRIVSDSYKICDFLPSGPHHISTAQTSVNDDGTLKGYQIIDEYSCEGESITFFRMRQHYMQKQDFLPYRVYSAIAEKAKTENQDYLAQFDLLNHLKKAKVNVVKSYFYDGWSESKKRKAFVVEGDEVFIDRIAEDWIRVAYEGTNSVTKGWLKRQDLEIIE